MSDILDLFIPAPAILSHLDFRKPLCNKGAKAPEDPPPAVAPYRADTSSSEQAVKASKRRKGLRSTILADGANPTEQSNTLGSPNSTLGSTTVLGGMASTNPIGTVK